MKIVYMGTPDFAVPALEMLIEEGQDVALVVTRSDKPQKRGKKVLPSPVKTVAMEHGLTVTQPEVIKGNRDFFNQVTDVAPDLIVVAAYGKILPLEILNIPKFGAINIHGSVLPKYRGAAPIHRAVEDGEEETGITLMYMSEGLDEGDMIAVSKTAIGRKTTGELHDELADMGAQLLKEKLKDIEAGSIERTKQDDSLATYAHMLDKEDGHIDFEKSGIEIERKIRAMTPYPGAYTYLDDKKMKIMEADVLKCDLSKTPGEIIKVTDKIIEVKAGDDSSVIIKKLQMPGKKAMDTETFLRGNKIDKGLVLR